MKNFFISYNKADKQWAEWMAWALEEAKYSLIIQAWDFLPGSNFVMNMHQAIADCERTIAVLSADYLAAVFTLPEWAAAFADDPQGEKRKLLPVRVGICDPPGLLKTIVYCDLVGLNEQQAREKLLSAALNVRSKPKAAPGFPGPPVREAEAAALEDPVLAAAKKLLDILKTTYKTFVAQARIRDQLHASMISRLNTGEQLEYEELFHRYYDQMNEEERGLHNIMRNYTIDVLSEYNKKALELIEENPTLQQEIPKLKDLQSHLIVWINKYERVFKQTPSLPLLYVGVVEKVPFPRGVEDDIENYIVKFSRKDAKF